MFIKKPALGVPVLVLAALSIVLMLVDARLGLLKPVRSQVGMALTPFYWLADIPERFWNTLSENLTSHTRLVAENERLKVEMLLLEQRLQKLAELAEQNEQLRALLNSAQLIHEEVLVAELIGVDPNPFAQRILINKGTKNGVYVGQAALDAHGLLGQVVEVAPYTARVLLLTDATHSIPVQVNRNGLRAIAAGTGDSANLDLLYVPDTADIVAGDLLVSSGLDQRFPAGYPVAVVTEVVHDPGAPFAVIRAQPSATMNQGRYLLLVIGHGQAPEAQEVSAQELPVSTAVQEQSP